jgi:hypothetical protein
MKPLSKFSIVALLLVIATLSAQAQTFDVKTHTLKNGMKILVQEDRSIPERRALHLLPRRRAQ